MDIAISKPAYPIGKPVIRPTLVKTWWNIQFWLEISKQRRQLAELTHDQIRDLGLTPEQIRTEISKPFWIY